jgi:hypothetical protein
VGTLSNNNFERKCNWFVWEGFRTGITAGYRFNTFGVEMGNYYSSNDKTMAQTTNRLISYDPATSQQQRM